MISNQLSLEIVNLMLNVLLCDDFSLRKCHFILGNAICNRIVTILISTTSTRNRYQLLSRALHWKASRIAGTSNPIRAITLHRLLYCGIIRLVAKWSYRLTRVKYAPNGWCKCNSECVQAGMCKPYSKRERIQRTVAMCIILFGCNSA